LDAILELKDMTKTNYELRYAAHPDDARHYPTERLRHDFLIEKIFAPDEVNMVYSMYDRMIVGGAMPVVEKLHLEAIDPLKQPIFLHSRELGIFNVGGDGKVYVADKSFELTYKEALYIGAGDREVYFESLDPQNPAKFYFNSATAHRNYPDRKVTKSDAVVMEMGALETSNHRNINRMLVNQVLLFPLVVDKDHSEIVKGGNLPMQIRTIQQVDVEGHFLTPGLIEKTILDIHYTFHNHSTCPSNSGAIQ
jgi:4-deoxy-L-threo-5-hexosulose-uronate ketol-isomerase